MPVEYWHAYAGRWTTDGTLTISKSRTKLHLDYKGLYKQPAININDNQRRNQRITFFLYNLVVEHSDPIARNFLAILSGGGQILRHRIAFYSEADGNFATVLLKKLGAQIIVRRLVAEPFQIQTFAPRPWIGKKRLLQENERDLLNDRVTQLRRESIVIGEDLVHHNPIEVHKEKSTTGTYFRH